MKSTRILGLAWHALLMASIAIGPSVMASAQSMNPSSAHHAAMDHAGHDLQVEMAECHGKIGGTEQSPGQPEPLTPDPSQPLAPPCASHCLVMGAVLPAMAWKTAPGPHSVAFSEMKAPPIELISDVELRPPIA